MYGPVRCPSRMLFDEELFDGVLKRSGLLEQLLPRGVDRGTKEDLGLHVHHCPERNKLVNLPSKPWKLGRKDCRYGLALGLRDAVTPRRSVMDWDQVKVWNI